MKEVYKQFHTFYKTRLVKLELIDNNNSYFILGIGGKQRILDIGGVPYLVPLAQKHKLYDMRDYPVLTEMDIKGEEEALF